MFFKKKELELTNEILIDIVRVAKEVFCDGIYIPCNEHPCGWDFIEFSDMYDYEEVLDYEFSSYNISNGCYINHPYENKTLKGILIECECKFEFES